MEMTECDPLRRAKGAGVSDPIERHSHISITRQTPVGIVHADMHITSVEISGMPGDMGDDLVGRCVRICGPRARRNVCWRGCATRLTAVAARMAGMLPVPSTSRDGPRNPRSLYAALRSCPETRFRLGPLSRSSASRIKRACIIKRNNKITNGSARLSLGQTRCRLL